MKKCIILFFVLFKVFVFADNVNISGLIEVIYHKEKDEKSGIEMGVELYFEKDLTDNVSAEVSLEYDFEEEKVIVSESIIIISDFLNENLNLITGLAALPFGVYNNLLISDQLVEVLGDRTEKSIFLNYIFQELDINFGFFMNSDDVNFYSNKFASLSYSYDYFTFGAGVLMYKDDSKNNFKELNFNLNIEIDEFIFDFEHTGELDGDKSSANTFTAAYNFADKFQIIGRFEKAKNYEIDTVFSFGFSMDLRENLEFISEFRNEKDDDDNKTNIIGAYLGYNF